MPPATSDAQARRITASNLSKETAMLPMTTIDFLTAENEYRHSTSYRPLDEARNAGSAYPRRRHAPGRTRRALRRTVERIR
jgi:hypothetical protein